MIGEDMRGVVSVVIIDDEEPAREILRFYLKDCPGILVVGEADNGFDGMKIIRDLCPQLVFLDIQMPKLTGFEMLELLDNPPEVIFSTAYDQYAIRAFESNAVDYLLKPYSKERFEVALQKALSKIANGANSRPALQKLSESREVHQEKLVRIAVKDRQQIHVIPTQDIDYIEACGDYVYLHTARGSFIKEKTMKFFEENLPGEQFIRIHRSYIVNVNEVTKIELYEKESYRVYLRNGKILKASASGYKTLKDIVRL